MLLAIAHPAVVSENPVDTTPHISLDSGHKMKALEQIGRTMYAGGRFEYVRDPTMTITYDRENFFAFDADTGAILPLALSFDGSVNTIVASEDETALFLGGSFDKVNGADYEGLIKYDLINNRIDPTFSPSDRMKTVAHLQIANGALYVSGNFSKHIMAMDQTTGEDLGTIDINVEGAVDSDHATRVTHFAVSPDGTRLVATGNFETVNGENRQRAFMLNLGATEAMLSTWYAPRFEFECDRPSRADSAQDVDFSPDGSYFAIAANGGSGLEGICDAVARFETDNVSSTVEPTWINWTGGDTLYSVAITGAAVYVGGHQRWLDNTYGDDEAGPGAVDRPGIGAIDPVTGLALEWNPTKSRDDGTRVLFATSEGLWVGSDGPLFANEEHFGIAFVPLEQTSDAIPPQTYIDSGPLGPVLETSATFTFSANETSTFRCRLDDAGFSPCTSPVTYENLTPGSHTFQVIATDESSNVDPTPAEQSWTVYSPGQTLQWHGSISTSSDDAEEDSSGEIDLRSSDLELVYDKSTQQVVGLRFTDVSIPFGASIQNAYIQFQADEENSDLTTLTIFGEATDHASTFFDTDGNISSRPKTSNSVAWSPTPWTTNGRAGVDEQTPNIAPIIQEIVTRPGWSIGNALSFILNGTGVRVAESIDGEAEAAAKLHVEYSLENLEPTTTGIADVNENTDAPNTVIDLFAAFDDVEDPDSALTYLIVNNTNASLFTSTSIDAMQGKLTLDYASGTNGEADITVRATDTGDPAKSVETTFHVSVTPPNQQPTTIGIANISETEGADNQMINLWSAFDDPDGPDSALTFSLESNTNWDLFTSADINQTLGTLTLDFAPYANGTADITIRATDQGTPNKSVATTFTVNLAEVNNTPIHVAGSVENLIVEQNSPATSLDLQGLEYGSGGGADENDQTLTYSVTSLPTSLGDILLADGTTPVSTGNYTWDQMQGMQFRAAPDAIGGPQTFSFTVTDNGTTNGVADFKMLDQSLMIRVIEALPDPIIFDVQVATSSDDAEERSNGDIKLNSSDLELIRDKSLDQVVGIRFTSVNVPSGANIQKAYIQFQADQVSTETTSLAIFGEAVDNALTFEATEGNISNRPRTSASVSWLPDPWTTVGRAGTAEQSPDIAAVIQELVNRPGWSSGSALAIIIDGAGERVAEAIDGDASGAAKLHVEYLPGNIAPTTSGIADVVLNTDAPDTVIDLFAAFDDFEDADAALTYSIENNTNSGLFASTGIDGNLGTLTLDYPAATNGTADLTIRATDTGDPVKFVETTFTVTVAPVNQPPTTTGITSILAVEDADDAVINLFAAFDDPDGSDSELTFSIQGNSNWDLFSSVDIDPVLGTLILDYAPESSGMATLTIRATDSGVPIHSVATTFTVDLSEVNDAPVRSAGTIDNLTFVQDSPTTSLGLAGLVYGPGGGIDENSQTLSYSVTSVPASLGDVVLSDGTTVVAPGSYTLSEIQGMHFRTVPGVFGGPETFSFTVTDNGTTDGVADVKSLVQSLEINVLEFVPDPIIVDVQIATGSDDAEEKSSGRVRISSRDLELGQKDSVLQVVGLRFTELDIPAGATIQNAYIQFQADEVNSELSSLMIYGEAVDQAATFRETNGNVSSRPKTSESVSWAPAPWTIIGQAGVDERTPDIAAVIQEIVNRPGWSSGNALAIIISGSGARVAESIEGKPAAAPTLHVEYLPSNLPSTIIADSNGTSNPDQLILIDLFAGEAMDDQGASTGEKTVEGDALLIVDRKSIDDVDPLIQSESKMQARLLSPEYESHDLSQVDQLFSELGSSLSDIELTAI